MTKHEVEAKLLDYSIEPYEMDKECPYKSELI
jgi:hypothetical protein